MSYSSWTRSFRTGTVARRNVLGPVDASKFRETIRNRAEILREADRRDAARRVELLAQSKGE